MARERWLCGNRITRRLTGDEPERAFDEAMTAWRIRRTQAKIRGKATWHPVEAVHVHEAREALRATKAPMFLLDNGTTVFTCSTRYGQEWYFLSDQLLTSLPPLEHPQP